MNYKTKTIIAAIAITTLAVGTVAVITLKPKRDEKTIEEYMGLSTTIEQIESTTEDSALNYNSDGEKYINPFDSSNPNTPVSNEASGEGDDEVGILKNDVTKVIQISGKDVYGIWKKEIDCNKYANPDWIYNNINPNTDNNYNTDFTFIDNPDLISTNEETETLATIKSIYKDNYTIDFMLEYEKDPKEVLNSYWERYSDSKPVMKKLDSLTKNVSEVITVTDGTYSEVVFAVSGEESGLTYAVKYQGTNSAINEMVNIVNNTKFK